MSFKNRASVIIVICLVSIVLDQGTKWLASEYLARGPMTSYFFDLFRIGYAENVGAFLGMGSDLSPDLRFLIFTVIVGCFLSALTLFVFIYSKHTSEALVAWALVLSGGVSNFYDRAVNNGAVVDFLNLGIGSLRTGIFNIADVAIMIGVGFLLWDEYLRSKREKQAKQAQG
ncbi:MAG: signal peptidase II [Alteromonadaceae bacterium]|nr:MAG: signal peptidase II [Alteromonadaceae bacterium]